jgi:hypothetical protein
VVPPSRTRGVYEWIERSPPAEAVRLLKYLGEENEGRLF